MQSEQGKERVIHKSHLYTLSAVTGTSVTVRSAFDSGESVPAVKLPLPVAELLFDAPGGSTVHAVQGRTVPGTLVVHELAHPRTTKQWLYTAVSRGSGAGNVFALADRFAPYSDMHKRDRERWAMRKAKSLLAWDKAEGRAVSSAAQELAKLLTDEAGSEASVCESCKQPFVWALYSEHQPTLDRIDNALGHDCTNLMVTCLRCNRERGSRCGRADSSSSRKKRAADLQPERTVNDALVRQRL